LLLTHLRRSSLIGLGPWLAFTELLMWGYCALRGPAFLRAKFSSYRWLRQRATALNARRAVIETLRQRSDWQIVRGLQWGYAWDQFFTLGREHGPSTRQPVGGMPIPLNDKG
jgi:hypothetical protein